MQLTKTPHDEQNSLFSQHQLIQDLSSPSNAEHQRKTSSSLKHYDELVPPHDQQPVFSTRNSNQFRFYQEFKKIYTVSHHLSLQKERQAMILDSLVKRIRDLEENMKDKRQMELRSKDQNLSQNRVKRSRRTAEQIEKKYKCEVTFCQRLYGSEGSLQQHIKLKHPQLYQKMHQYDSMLAHNSSFML